MHNTNKKERGMKRYAINSLNRKTKRADTVLRVKRHLRALQNNYVSIMDFKILTGIYGDAPKLLKRIEDLGLDQPTDKETLKLLDKLGLPHPDHQERLVELLIFNR